MTAGLTTNHRDFNLLCNYSRMSCWHQFVSSWRNKHFLWQSVCSVGEHLNQDVCAGCLNAGKLCSREELMRLPLCRVSEDVTSRLRLITDIVFLLVSVESCTRSVPTRPQGRHRRRILFKISLTSVSFKLLDEGSWKDMNEPAAFNFSTRRVSCLKRRVNKLVAAVRGESAHYLHFSAPPC